jgi:hypothetical protein
MNFLDKITQRQKTFGAIGLIAGLGFSLYKKKCLTCTIAFSVIGLASGLIVAKLSDKK